MEEEIDWKKMPYKIYEEKHMIVQKIKRYVFLQMVLKMVT